MKCIHITELEQFVKGKLPAERLIEIDEHVSGCAECRALICGLLAVKKAGLEMGAALLGACDCPEYEELSNYVDGALAPDRKAALLSHINLCELCSRDAARISEMRSHAAMREKITVRPAGNKEATGTWFPAWKKFLVGVGIGVVAAVVAISFGRVGQAPRGPVDTTQKPAQVAKQKPSAPLVDVASVPERPKPVPANTQLAQAPSTQPNKPAYETVLRDGSYRVIKQDSKLQMAKGDGSPVRTSLPARIVGAIAQKLGTGRVKQAGNVTMAIAAITQRGRNDYAPSPTAPKPASPVSKILMTDRPTFNWSAVDLADSYRIRVFDVNGRIVVDEITSASRFTPSVPLERGKMYVWRVGVRFSESDPWEESAAVGFKVLSEGDFAAIQRTRSLMPGSHLALGATYESFGLYDEARREYKMLIRSNPRSALARKLLR